ncbi:MAG TPA: helix-turn-helix transcriptional regulator, partial [Pilimelia sp.]|nr:helix-turn-helix transcriptional regulator [Pilimelia sp.]
HHGGMDRRQLAEFLRSRRARTGPAEAGLPVGARRRTPGLRREEVAALAGISVDYYTRLEQARGPHPSRQVLEALARALRLDGDERSHLHHLAGEAPAPPTGPSPDVPDGILHLLDRLEDVPAFVVDAKYELLAWNPVAAAMLGDPEQWAGRRNLAWQTFLGPYAVQNAADPSATEFADHCVADLRAAAGRYPRDRPTTELIAELRAGSAEFARRWAEHRVATRVGTTKRVQHPLLGELVLECEPLEIPDRGQRLILYTATPGSPTAEALRLLAALGPRWQEQPAVPH